MDTLTEGIIDRNRGTLSGQDGRINRRGRQAGKTHQHEEESHIRMDGKNKRHNTIPKIQAINIEIYQWKVSLIEGSIGRKRALTQQTEMTHQQDGRAQYQMKQNSNNPIYHYCNISIDEYIDIREHWQKVTNTLAGKDRLVDRRYVHEGRKN